MQGVQDGIKDAGKLTKGVKLRVGIKEEMIKKTQV